MITDFNQLDLSKQYNYADYLTWMFEDRVELFKGWVMKMCPAPNLNHQRISWQLSMEIGSFIKGKKCEAFSAPFDVRLMGKSKQKNKLTLRFTQLCNQIFAWFAIKASLMKKAALAPLIGL